MIGQDYTHPGTHACSGIQRSRHACTDACQYYVIDHLDEGAVDEPLQVAEPHHVVVHVPPHLRDPSPAYTSSENVHLRTPHHARACRRRHVTEEESGPRSNNFERGGQKGKRAWRVAGNNCGRFDRRLVAILIAGDHGRCSRPLPTVAAAGEAQRRERPRPPGKSRRPAEGRMVNYPAPDSTPRGKCESQPPALVRIGRAGRSSESHRGPGGRNGQAGSSFLSRARPDRARQFYPRGEKGLV